MAPLNIIQNGVLTLNSFGTFIFMVVMIPNKARTAIPIYDFWGLYIKVCQQVKF
jgi:hypothetical protein